MASILKKALILLLLLLVFVASELYFFSNEKFKLWITQTYRDKVLGKYDHMLPCESLPTIEQARQALLQNQDLKKRIEQISSGNVVIQIDDTKCYGKADILIEYSSRDEETRIMELLNGSTFKGIPVRVYHR